MSLRIQPGLSFKIGTAVGLAMMKMEGDAAVSMRAIAQRLKSIGPVRGIAARAVLLAFDGGDLHIAAAICDSEALQAASTQALWAPVAVAIVVGRRRRRGWHGIGRIL